MSLLTFVIAIVIIIIDNVIAIVNVISIYIVIVIVITIIIIVNVVVTNIVLHGEMTPCSSQLNVSEFCWIRNPSSEKHK